MKVRLGSQELEMEPAANIEKCRGGRCAGGCEAPNVRFYVSVLDYEMMRTAFLLGPFETHQAALDRVEKGRRKAEQVDLRAAWYAYGTVRVEGPPWPAGKLNEVGGGA